MLKTITINLKSINRALSSNYYSTVINKSLKLSLTNINSKQIHSNTCRRFISIYVTGLVDLAFDEEKELQQFGKRCENMGSEMYPGYRKERLKGKEKRKMKANGKIGKTANYRVRGLVDAIKLARFYKCQI